MKYYYKILSFVFIFCVISSLPSYAKGGLGALVKVGKSQAEMEKVMNNETKVFEKVKKAVINDEIIEGQSDSEIESKYGAPVVKIKQPENKLERWVYKPGYASYFDHNKVCIYVNEEGTVSGIELLR